MSLLIAMLISSIIAILIVLRMMNRSGIESEDEVMVYMELERLKRIIELKYNLSPEEVQDLEATLLTEMKRGKA